jgi:N-glycosylase/DNA lyase
MKTQLLLNYLISSIGAEMRVFPADAPHFAVEKRPIEIWRQKVFCVLSSQVSAQKAALVTERLLKCVPFFDCTMRLDDIEAACLEVLGSRDVGYRFPKIRAKQISFCWFLFWQVKDSYHEYVQSFGSEDCARLNVIKTFPGIGFKQASMFLRNIGAARNLAVIDVHVLTYLRVCHAWDSVTLTAKKYLEAEDILRKEALYHGLELNIYDPIVWSAVRALKKVKAYV